MASQMGDLKDAIERQLPVYLSDQEQYNLIKNINCQYPNTDYYSYEDRSDILQGDGWTALEIINFYKPGEKKEISAIILSNTCDISPENQRIVPANIIFAPVLRVAEYYKKLANLTQDTQKIDSYFASIKNQSVSNRFYLPHSSALESDFVAILDDIHSMPAKFYLEKSERKLRIKLSAAGFYIFILKLSIHFCRLFDGAKR